MKLIISTATQQQINERFGILYNNQNHLSKNGW